MPWDFIANIGQQQNIGQGKSYWPSGPYTGFKTVFIFRWRLSCDSYVFAYVVYCILRYSDVFL